MMTDYLSTIIGIIISMLFSAFFSGMEIAFVSGNRMLAEMDGDARGGRRPLAFFYRHPDNFVSTMLVGNNIALVIYGILIARLFDNTLFRGLEPAFTVPADTVLSTLIVLFTGEFLPKVLFKSNANRLLSFFAFPALVCYVVLWPVARFATMLSRGLLLIVGVRMRSGDSDGVFTKLDLDNLLQTGIDSASDGDHIDDEVRIFRKALDFADTKVRDCMIPRTEICAVADDSSVDFLRGVFIESGKSKIIVYHADIDHIIGYVHSSELFRLAADTQPAGTTSLQSVLRPVSFVPETMSAGKLMHGFLQQHRSISVVIDEFGGTSGIVTLEDIVEEILGDIEDEHDSTNYVARRLSDNEYLLSARLEIGKINEMFALSLPESDDYMTLGGLILHYYESFPKLNETVVVDRFELRIVKNTMTKIELVRLKVNEK